MYAFKTFFWSKTLMTPNWWKAPASDQHGFVETQTMALWELMSHLNWETAGSRSDASPDV